MSRFEPLPVEPGTRACNRSSLFERRRRTGHHSAGRGSPGPFRMRRHQAFRCLPIPTTESDSGEPQHAPIATTPANLPEWMIGTMDGEKHFIGWSVAWAAFTLAVLAWG